MPHKNGRGRHPSHLDLKELIMNEHQKDQILKILAYYMPQELRQKVMQEAPMAYNAWMNSDVVEVRIKDTGRIIDGTVPPPTRLIFTQQTEEYNPT